MNVNKVQIYSRCKVKQKFTPHMNNVQSLKRLKNTPCSGKKWYSYFSLYFSQLLDKFYEIVGEYP